MSLRNLSAVAAAGLLCLSIVTASAQDTVLPATDAAIAAMTPEQLVEARKSAMREDGSILRNSKALAGADMVTAADTLVKNFTNLPHMFPEGSIVGDSKALPAIWENWEAFAGLFAEARVASEAALVAAQAGDQAGFQTALQPIGPLCGQCHQQFRAE